MPHKTIIRLSGVARNPANGFPARLLERFLLLFRVAAEELSAMEGIKISNLDDFPAPCQIHLFWFRAEPNLDYCCLLQTKLRNSPDGLVEVVGPMHPADTMDHMSEVLTWDRWSEALKGYKFLNV